MRFELLNAELKQILSLKLHNIIEGMGLGYCNVARMSRRLLSSHVFIMVFIWG
jgi:hypothetical protein